MSSLRKSIASGLLAGVVAYGWAALAAADVSVVKSVSGSVWKTSAIGGMETVGVGSELKPGDTLKTGFDSVVESSLGGDGRSVYLDANSAVRFDRLTSSGTAAEDAFSAGLSLLQGSMAASSDNFGPGSKLDVQMSEGSVSAQCGGGPGALNVYYSKRTGDIYNFSATAVTLTLKLDVTWSKSTKYPVPTPNPGYMETVSIPSGYRFVMPTSFDMNVYDTKTASLVVSKIPKHTTWRDIQRKGYTVTTSHSISETFYAKITAQRRGGGHDDHDQQGQQGQQGGHEHKGKVTVVVSFPPKEISP